MYREIMKDLEKWKNRSRRKPLMLSSFVASWQGNVIDGEERCKLVFFSEVKLV
jgi:hypothetical protein